MKATVGQTVELQSCGAVRTRKKQLVCWRFPGWGMPPQDERRSRNVEPDEDAEARSSEAELMATLKS